jgi:hypothetical protein
MEHLSSAMEQQYQQVQWRRDKRALQQRIHPKENIPNVAGWISYSK